MGQTISFPHIQLARHNSERLRQHNNNNNSESFVRRSSMGGRLRSYGVILYEPPTPTSNGPTSDEDAASTPSPVVNDMISVQRRQWPAKTDSNTCSALTVTTLTTTTERSFMSWTPSSSSSSTITPRRRIGPGATSSPAPAHGHASSSSGWTDAIVPMLSRSRVTHDRIMLSSSAASSVASSTTTMVVCGGSKAMMTRLPKLRLGELEQIFSAIVKSDNGPVRAKIALSA